MKAKYSLLAMALILGTTALAQEVDDMYFNAKDRAGQSESNQAAMASRYAVYDQQAVQSNPVNPSDSYTGRGVNPEFSAQQKNGTELITEKPDYFLSSYTTKDINSNLYSGSATSYNCGCGNTNSGYSGFGNPYNPYGNYSSPYYSPYSGLSTTMGYGFGSYGSAMSLGMSYGMGSMYGSSYGMYSPYGYSNSTVVVIGADIAQSYGKRPARGSSINRQSSASNAGGYIAAGTNGRSRATHERSSQGNYYNSSWKSDPSNFSSRSYGYGDRSSGYSSGSTTGRSWGQDTGARTRSAFDSFGSGTRGSMGNFGGTSGGGASSPSSGGHSRGRN